MRTINLTATNIEFIFDELVKHISSFSEKERTDVLINLFKERPNNYVTDYIKDTTSAIILDAIIYFLLEFLSKNSFKDLEINSQMKSITAIFYPPNTLNLFKIRKKGYSLTDLYLLLTTLPINNNYSYEHKEQSVTYFTELFPYFIEPCRHLYNYITLKNSVIRVNSNV